MPYIIWSDFFSVGVPYIDRQHQRLIHIVNDFYAAYRSNLPEHLIFQILNQLTEYAEEHFRDEERLMKAAKYPREEYEQHIKKHEKLLLDIFEINDQLSTGNKRAIFNLELFLNTWLIRHILETDKLYQPYCRILHNFNPSEAKL